MQNLAYFVRTHERALANAFILQRQAPSRGHGISGPLSPVSATASSASVSGSSIASGLSIPYLTSPTLKPAKLTLTPHHLFFLLSRFEDLGISVGPMNVRLENLHSETSPTNYVSFLSQAQRKKSRSSDRDSIHSVSSIRSVMSGMSSLLSSLGFSTTSAAKTEKQKALIQEDLKYLYSAFTKIPCLKLAPDHKSRLIAGYEEFPFDSAVPLFAFKNISALEICDVDFRQFHGWDRLAEQLRSLTVKRAGVEDPADLLIHIVLDDIDKRRKRSAKVPMSPAQPWPAPTLSHRQSDLTFSSPNAASPGALDRRAYKSSPQSVPMTRGASAGSPHGAKPRNRSASPMRPSSSKNPPPMYGRASTPNIRRSSGSSGSSAHSHTPRGSSSNLLSFNVLPWTKWRFLRHLSLADNSLTVISATSLVPVANTLQSLDLSSNLFTEIPDSLATLVSLRALNLSNCMIASLHSLARNPLPAITTLNLRANRLSSLAGIERLLSLERLDLRDNRLTDPTEVARLTGVPEFREVHVSKNPFVKSYGNYRVTIFNVFRSTPGFIDDITIDGSGPGYSERKQLVDRAPEPVIVPVIKPPLEDEEVKVDRHATRPEPIVIVPSPQPQISPTRERSKHHRTRSDLGSSRRRKGPKRRVVELTQSDSLRRTNSDSPAVLADSLAKDLPPLPVGNREVPTSARATETRGNPHRVKSPTRERLSEPRLSPENPVLGPPESELSEETNPKPHPSFDVSSDLYKKKIEALRHDLGNNWLSALGDEPWDSQQMLDHFRESDLSNGSMRPPPPPVRNPSQGVVSGGRTLG